MVLTRLAGYFVISYAAVLISGVISRNWPEKPTAPLMPTGPIRSGALPDAISVLRMSVAVAFWTISSDSTIGILPSVRASCFVLKSLTTVACSAIWAGLVPEPRPTYQRTIMWSLPPMLTIWPGFVVDGTIDGAIDAGVTTAADAPADGAVVAADPPQA